VKSLANLIRRSTAERQSSARQVVLLAFAAILARSRAATRVRSIVAPQQLILPFQHRGDSIERLKRFLLRVPGSLRHFL